MKKEFYFIRHGQTDHHDNDDYISLNNLGLEQAARAKNLIDTLKISSVYHSPLKRAIQTKDILFSEIELEHIEVGDLAECTTEIWHSITNNNIYCSKTNNFISKAVNGMQMALNNPGSSIVVAHGGIHYAFCKHHNIKNHQWIIDNCVLVHFKRDEESWTANIITD
jgi:probable phosphoglycerate mutase